MISKTMVKLAKDWHKARGGSFVEPHAHALKLLGETIELCFALGASAAEVQRLTAAEVSKEVEKGLPSFGSRVRPQDIPEWFGNEAVKGELADVGLCFIFIISYMFPGQEDILEDLMHLKIWELNDRMANGVVYEADRSGVVRRKGRDLT